MDTCSLFSMFACSVSLRPGQWRAEVRGSVQMLSRRQMSPALQWQFKLYPYCPTICFLLQQPSSTLFCCISFLILIIKYFLSDIWLNYLGMDAYEKYNLTMRTLVILRAKGCMCKTASLPYKLSDISCYLPFKRNTSLVSKNISS